MYMDSLDITREDLIKDFSQDEDMRKSYEADKFMEMLAQGKIELQKVQEDDKEE